jgi:hypothetical protein
MYDVSRFQLNTIPFLQYDDYSVILDINRLILSFIPNFILNDPTTRLYDGVKVYSLEEANCLFTDDSLSNDIYRWVCAWGTSPFDMIYSVENLNNFTTKFIRVNRYKIKVQTGFGKKEYLWKGEHYFCIYEKYEQNLLKYRDLMCDFDFKDSTCVNKLISQLFEIKDQFCFDYVSYHIKSNLGLNLTRDLCGYELIRKLLKKLAGSGDYYTYNPTPELSLILKMPNLLKEQVQLWFNLLLESNSIYSNYELFETLFYAAWVLKCYDNSWDSMLKILAKCKIPHEVLNRAYGGTVEIFDLKGDTLLHFNFSDTRCYYTHPKYGERASGEAHSILWFHDILWRLWHTRPKETQETFVASEA